MPDVSITDLIAEARLWAPCAMTPEYQSKLINGLADALEAAEQRANTAEREMCARELHHFEAEELLAAAQAVIAEALHQTKRGNVATPPHVIAALCAQPCETGVRS